jgi:Protein of unknown function (DUF551)
MKMKWIDVREKLPSGEGAEQVIVCNEVNGTRLVLCAVWNGIDKVFYIIEEYGAYVEDEERVPTIIEHVSCWCELPNPPTAKRVEAQNTSTNSQMVAALWRALSDSDVKKAGNSRGVWLPLTKARLNAAYTKVFGL